MRSSSATGTIARRKAAGLAEEEVVEKIVYLSDDDDSADDNAGMNELDEIARIEKESAEAAAAAAAAAEAQAGERGELIGAVHVGDMCVRVATGAISAISSPTLDCLLSVTEERGRGRGAFRERMRRAAYVAT